MFRLFCGQARELSGIGRLQNARFPLSVGAVAQRNRAVHATKRLGRKTIVSETWLACGLESSN